MKTITPSQFDLEQIADSGQCFRWNRISDYKYRIVAFGKILNIEQDLETGSVTMDCSDSDFDNIWKDYFDLGTDYGKIIERIPEDDEYLKRAASICDGIRIIKQDPWETLITFIISQRKNIPAIKASVEKICKAAGKVIGEIDGEKLYAFPTPKELAALSESDLSACSLGYRAAYIYKAAHAVADGAVDLDKWKELSDDKLFDSLCSLYGVGKKVANCTMLFGFNRLDSFPIDVWMNKIRDRYYPNDFPIEAYRPYGGIMQQYMFAYERSINS
ncbi:N-glycosylase/DNA lyase [Butyrivibrio fibrisolvens DSM 3071]|uniref:DNA-(apurinic or apyrimidinic site) lyase n=1 Tax=Butyrivibrio fibrisolvens DSM 3071 TaxID=1121131 RepID=A0A1M5V3R1_BUTFI|nr:DNA glycosylase [Butyrivibrio fibrisolvens]SHH69917.1 N-glycosylase/DNA lyase [Butyrivibrio fibrisolvens DSM 3071]